MTARKPDGVALTPDVPTLLAALGGTADEVAQSLRAAGIRGYRHASGQCPIARHLRSAGVRSPNVSHVVAFRVDGELMEASVPMPCIRFILEFDAGHYPDLVEVSP